MRKARIAAAITAMLFMAGVSAPALASTSAHQRGHAGSTSGLTPDAEFSGTFHICTNLNNHYCLISNGSATPMTIASSGYANVTLTEIPGFTNTYTFTNGNGKCVRENSTGTVRTESTGCNSSDPSEQWVPNSTSGGVYFHNNGQDNLMVVQSITAGGDVKGGTTKNDWHWLECIGKACSF
jgi:hypothetical protein